MDTVKTFKKEMKKLFVLMDKEDMDRLHKIILEMLHDFVSFCDENNLTYYFIDGSAIGAVRENGFIPWDDDVDIVMPRADYNRLRDTYEANYPDKYIIEAPFAKQISSLQFMKIRKKGTKYRGLMAMGPEYGIFLDIFPLDYAPHSWIHRQFCSAGYFILKSLHYSVAFYMLYDDVFRPHEKECSLNLRIHMKIKRLWGKLLSKKPLRKWLEDFDTMSQHKASKYYAYPSDTFAYNKQCYPVDYFYPPRKVRFEDMEVSIPNKTEKILANIYGDYMTPPADVSYPITGCYEVDFGEEK